MGTTDAASARALTTARAPRSDRVFKSGVKIPTGFHGSLASPRGAARVGQARVSGPPRGPRGFPDASRAFPAPQNSGKEAGDREVKRESGRGAITRSKAPVLN
ncbi:hypothetical protein SKAU_G00073480 [Synaphobranchus kaupii]|uniref:Uncharacterized protein n=1 Tax=Synaphobranchus kaupii TaxID=118154 RepID=A0A9Q1G835_SYNKA|nr:hypothetical protein SKAU_G00073480 [Synaphobranchus kaupii]